MLTDIPPSGAKTLCEVHSRLVTNREDGQAAESPSRRLEAAGLPASYRDIQLSQADETRFLEDFAPVITLQRPEGENLHSPDQGEAEPECYSRSNEASTSGLLQLARGTLSWLTGGTVAGLLPPLPAPKPIAWHRYKPWLAVADDAERVHVFEAEGLAAASPSPQDSVRPKVTLCHEFQRAVSLMQWRPHAGNVLAVACAHGAALWTLGRGPLGPQSGLGSGGGAWMAWLRSRSGGPVAAMDWHPTGRLLATASRGAPGFVVWDVALGVGTPLQAGRQAVSLLRWSPDGSYLVAGGGGVFQVWEAQHWWHASWSWQAGRLVSADWSPDSRVLLLAFDVVGQVAALHFTADAPSLLAQLLPLSLPEIEAPLYNSPGEMRCVRAVAWDGHGERLAVALGGQHPAAGMVALYATSYQPMLSASFVGYIQGPLLGAAEDGSDAEAKDPPVALAFQSSLPNGSLLAVRRGSQCISIYPLYYTPRL